MISLNLAVISFYKSLVLLHLIIHSSHILMFRYGIARMWCCCNWPSRGLAPSKKKCWTKYFKNPPDKSRFASPEEIVRSLEFTFSFFTIFFLPVVQRSKCSGAYWVTLACYFQGFFLNLIFLVDSFGSIQVAGLDWGNDDHIKAVHPPFDYIIGTDIVSLMHLSAF